MTESFSAEARLIHAGTGRAPGQPATPPLVPASIYVSDGPPQPGRGYGRESNPGWEALEEALGGLEDAQAVAGRLQKLTVRVKRRAGSNGRLFGSVGASDIAAALKDAGGPEIDKRTIVVPDPIKAAGAYRVQVRLHPEVTASLNVEVSGA